MSRIDDYRKVIDEYEARPDPTIIRCVEPTSRTEYYFPVERITKIQRDGLRDEFFIHVSSDERTFYIDRTDGVYFDDYLQRVNVADHYAARLKAVNAATTIEMLEEDED